MVDNPGAPVAHVAQKNAIEVLTGPEWPGYVGAINLAATCVFDRGLVGFKSAIFWSVGSAHLLN
jgi:hypothetical protein